MLFSKIHEPLWENITQRNERRFCRYVCGKHRYAIFYFSLLPLVSFRRRWLNDRYWSLISMHSYYQIWLFRSDKNKQKCWNICSRVISNRSRSCTHLLKNLKVLHRETSRDWREPREVYEVITIYSNYFVKKPVSYVSYFLNPTEE